MKDNHDWRIEAGIPRRSCLDKMTNAERAIFDAMQVVETVGAHKHLTDAVVLLGQARDKVADFVENVPVNVPVAEPG